MLNSLLATRISSNDKYETTYEDWVEKITSDAHDFMNDTRLAFQASHPGFIRFLEDKELTTEEINYVCLYALGLNGKEVGSYIKKPGHVNMSSVIRKKLGLDKHSTNLNIYIRNLIQTL